MNSMQRLSHRDYSALTEHATTLEEDGFGVKVLALSSGNILKLFRRKRLLTSAAIWPYATRFAKNAHTLHSLNIPCPTIIEVYKIPSIQRDGVLYEPLPGKTLRQLQSPEFQSLTPKSLFTELAEFVAQLHQLGIYFRSIHLGNIVFTPDNQLGLIDIADLKVQPWPLTTQQRTRNFKHMLRDSKDTEWLASKAFGDFEQRYQALTGYNKNIV